MHAELKIERSWFKPLPELDPCALFLGETLLSCSLTVPHSTAPGPGVLKGTGECSAGASNPMMDYSSSILSLGERGGRREIRGEFEGDRK